MDACLTCSRFDAAGPVCTTSLSGTVFDPAGLNPLFNVVAFVPSDPLGHLPAITPSTPLSHVCDWTIGDYVTATVTDVKGHFKLIGVPATTHVPLVVQAYALHQPRSVKLAGDAA
jgi:hypothetical protein